jgi:ABC-type molybdate transport system substrate-binding protein
MLFARIFSHRYYGVCIIQSNVSVGAALLKRRSYKILLHNLNDDRNLCLLLKRLVLLAPVLWLMHAPPALSQGRTVVYAAVSVKDALDEIVKRFDMDTGSRIIPSYAGSPMLARQIEKGAPADLFISADTDWMDYLDRRKAIRAHNSAQQLV